ncbi:acyl-CoA synthetase (AMP-forming)/AMP-acid ligase II [Antricoccus suffuscus]|uniref:Acyl-CoA synthetase (AMP-forming)/AMP-acid ligase II n=1 Tax=Antricoccus suffuscus TaxID=1629062 RepID=A0A2T1A5N6_9ACTN|nr:long-chain-fatty-acid--CoA ligase [Antricoccus suffuscus]PRZ43922.1 acyl-CoA synthetase (AMP-forming)/AMP-acid ligase II [Antricoccus suffuscus]
MHLTAGLHRSIQRDPDGIAIVDGAREITFTELAERVARLASGLAGLGASPGDRIGMLATNSPRYLEYVLACLWGGYVFAPVNSRWSREEMTYQINDAGIGLLIVGESGTARARELRETAGDLRSLVFCGSDPAPDGFVDYEQLISGSAPVEDCRLGGKALAAILYTGGTTGTPKGVMISPEQLLVSGLGTLVTAGMANMPERFLHVSPLYHLAALASALQQVQLGSTHVVLGDFDVPTLVEAIQKHRITATTLVPTMIQRLVAYVEETGVDISTLVRLGYGASPISQTTLRDVQRLLPGIQLCQRYGMTELGPVATVLTPEDHLDRDHPERLKSAGRAAAHAEVRVVDTVDKELPVGEIGEIVVRGGNLMLGYWNKPAETAEALRGGWMHTGDVGYFDRSGYLYVVDRLKDMIVSGGENVYSAEVEKVLALHPAVASCAVIGVPDDDWGERVHAVVVLRPGAQVTAGELREHCGAHIARYKAPRTVFFTDALPVSAVGKILKRELRASHETDAADSTKGTS